MKDPLKRDGLEEAKIKIRIAALSATVRRKGLAAGARMWKFQEEFSELVEECRRSISK